MISGITALGVRVRDRDDLFNNACRIAVDHGDFAMAVNSEKPFRLEEDARGIFWGGAS